MPIGLDWESAIVPGCCRWPIAVAVCLCAALAAQGQDRAVETAVGAEQAAGERAPQGSNQPQPSAAPERPPPAGAAEASPLDTFLLRDSKGNLVPVPGIPFEEFEQLLRAKRGLTAATAPSFVVESLSITGEADERTADLRATATIQVRAEGWVRVPLGMPTVVLRSSPKCEGPGEHFLDYDRALGGLICGLKGNGRYVLTLDLACQLHRLGDEQRLMLALPRATESSLRVTIRGGPVDASLLAGEGIVTARSTGRERTEITVLGPAGEMQLAWRPRREASAKGTGQLEVSGEIAVRIESEHRITSDARLRVRSFAGSLETFRVRLPPGMELVPFPTGGGFTASPLAMDANDRAPSIQIVEVRLDKPATTATEVVLRAQRQPDATGAIFPARFDVQGAIRQRGSIDFSMDGEWQLDWTEDHSVHRLDLTPDAAAARLVARYEYFRQPCGLELTVAPRPSRVSVEPTHIVYVDRQRVRVETMLKYRFRGARPKGLGFELGDWTFDRLTPDALLDLPTATGESGSPLEVPLRAGAAPPTELELKLEAHRVLTAPSERLSLTFPRPAADIVAPATIMIAAADNIELTPQTAELVGLSPDPTSVRLPLRQQPPLVYRDLGGGEPALFNATMRPLARTTTTSGHANVRIDRAQMQVDQKLDYRILHEPQRTFRLLAPRELAASGNLQVWLGSEPLALNAVPQPHAANPSLMRLEFSTPTEMIGEFALAVRYSQALRWDGQKPLALKLPLVLPLDEGDDDQFTGQQIEFALAEGLQVRPDLDADIDGVQPTAAGGDLLHYAWSNPPAVSAWTVELTQATKAATVNVSQVWIQTWLAPLIRQDRVVMRLSTLQETVRIRLPKGVIQSSVLVAIDSREASSTFREPGGVLIVSMPAENSGRECVLEVCYALNPPDVQLGLASDVLKAAQIDGTAPRRVYWQLVLPENEHLLLLPSELAPEMRWSLERWPLSRHPIMDQHQLEAWVKASRQEPLPRGVNEYLFGTLGRWPLLHFTSASRPLVMSVASGSILLVGLLLIHVPRLRSPAILLVAAVLLALAALAAPDFAIVAGQGAALGLIIALAAAAVSWVAAARATVAPPPASTIVTRPRETPSSQATALRGERSSRIGSTASGGAPAMEVRP